MHVGPRKAKVELSIWSRWLVWAGRRLDGDWEGRRGRILCSTPGESKAQTVREAPRRPRGEGAEFEAENEENPIHSLWVFGLVGPPCRDAVLILWKLNDLRPQIQLCYFYAFGMEIYMVGLFHLFKVLFYIYSFGFLLALSQTSTHPSSANSTHQSIKCLPDWTSHGAPVCRLYECMTLITL